ncbi:unnamed protein product [Meganyctiphanes norvegica]|uniref:Angiotensin-converting enzyme n=1 Tax=Meganyctiphanes norvegica TaxID=48144 RepID=A0AAV2RAT1_MEGNR
MENVRNTWKHVLAWMIITLSFSQASAATEDVDFFAEASALEFLERYNEEAQKIVNNGVHAAWNYKTNLTDHNANLSSEASLRSSAFAAKTYNESLFLRDAKLTKATKRAMKMVAGAVLIGDDIKKLTNITSRMTKIYGSGKVCSDKENNQTCLSLDPELQQLMKNSKDYEKLKWAWEEWRTAVGRKLKPLYLEYVELLNKQAKLNNYTDYGHQLRMRYESETFEEEMLSLYDELKPLYELLHSYVRRKFYNQYGPKIIKLNGPLPACILGDMWGRFWDPLFEFLQPYSSSDYNLDAKMKQQGYNVTQMFHMGEEFFTSMGLKKMPASFYDLSMLEKPSDGREVVCHPTAWDFYDGKDFRIKMCTTVTFENLQTIHHELGHIQYFMQYAHQPYQYRDGANDGFHEAIGELMSMSMTTPQHLEKVGLMKDVQYTKEDEINFLLKMSLSTVSTLPFHLVNDLWRWRAFRGEYKLEDWNDEYWKLKEQYLGVYAPVERTADDLDPPTIFHIANDYDMIRYFTRTVLQFQFLEVLCEEAGHFGPLHTCDIYGSTEAGEKLASVLSLGSSLPWQDALEKMTGGRKMSTKPLLKYFEPLKEFLMNEVCLNGDTVGWGENIQNDYCKDSVILADGPNIINNKADVSSTTGASSKPLSLYALLLALIFNVSIRINNNYRSFF